MNEGTWLRDVLRRAAEARPVPAPGDRVAGVLGVVRRRRRTRLVAASCTAAAAVFAAAALTGGGLVTTGLEPTDPASTRTATPPATGLPGAGSGPLTPAGGGPAGGGTSGPAPAAAPAGTVARPAAAGKPAFDVYVLLDATSNMSGFRDAARDAIDDVTRRLAATTTLRHGYGLFRDREAPLWLTGRGLYEQLSPVRANGGRLPKVRYSGGGDIPQAHTFGLDGALGIEHFPHMVDPPPAGFGAAARKLVLLVSDAPVKQGEGYPSIDQAIANLDAAGVAVVVLWIENLGHVDPNEAYDDMARFAAGTGATARRSLDCDGDRRIDIRRGRPLVCPFATKGNFAAFADAIVARFG